MCIKLGRAELEVLYRLVQPCLLVDRNARILFVNLAGEHMVAHSESLRLAGSVLSGTTPEATSELHRLVARAAGQSPVAGQMAISAASGRRSLIVVDPVPASEFLAAGTGRCAAVWVNGGTTRVPRLRRTPDNVQADLGGSRTHSLPNSRRGARWRRLRTIVTCTDTRCGISSRACSRRPARAHSRTWYGSSSGVPSH